MSRIGAPPAAGEEIITMQAGKRGEFPVPAWYGRLGRLAADPARHRVWFGGYGRATGDSVGIGTLSLDDGAQTQWATRFAEDARIAPLSAHAGLLGVWETQASLTLYALDTPGQATRLGTISRPVIGFSVTPDMTRATFTVRDYRADTWLNKVVRP